MEPARTWVAPSPGTPFRPQPDPTRGSSEALVPCARVCAGASAADSLTHADYSGVSSRGAAVKIVKTVLIGFVALLLLLILIGLFLPSAAHVERSTSIAAPPAAVFDLVNTPRRFNEWSPWYELDPSAQFMYSGPEQGVGARVQWLSKNPELGSGVQVITESEPDKRVRSQLIFDEEARAKAGAELQLAPEGEGTRVTWAFDMEAGSSLPSRYVGLALDRILGPYYERGLANLKVVAEAEAAQSIATAPVQISEVDVRALDIAYVEGVSAPDPAAMAEALDAAYVEVSRYLRANGLKQSGARLAITRFYDESGWGYEAAIPFSGPDPARSRASAARGAVKVGQTYAGRALRGVHIGPHAALPDAYRQLEDHMAQHKLEANGRSWQQYVTDAGSAPEGRLETHVFMPIKPGA